MYIFFISCIGGFACGALFLFDADFYFDLIYFFEWSHLIEQLILSIMVWFWCHTHLGCGHQVNFFFVHLILFVVIIHQFQIPMARALGDDVDGVMSLVYGFLFSYPLWLFIISFWLSLSTIGLISVSSSVVYYYLCFYLSLFSFRHHECGVIVFILFCCLCAHFLDGCQTSCHDHGCVVIVFVLFAWLYVVVICIWWSVLLSFFSSV